MPAGKSSDPLVCLLGNSSDPFLCLWVNQVIRLYAFWAIQVIHFYACGHIFSSLFSVLGRACSPTRADADERAVADERAGADESPCFRCLPLAIFQCAVVHLGVATLNKKKLIQTGPKRCLGCLSCRGHSGCIWCVTHIPLKWFTPTPFSLSMLDCMRQHAIFGIVVTLREDMRSRGSSHEVIFPTNS